MTDGPEWRMPWLCEARHSRESGNLETFATGRLALDGRPWVPGARSGSGSWNDVGAVDSRFHGDDRWVGMSVGGSDGWAGMADGVALRKVAFSRMPWLPKTRHSRESGNLETFATGRVGIGRAALGSWSPIGVGELE